MLKYGNLMNWFVTISLSHTYIFTHTQTCIREETQTVWVSVIYFYVMPCCYHKKHIKRLKLSSFRIIKLVNRNDLKNKNLSHFIKTKTKIPKEN